MAGCTRGTKVFYRPATLDEALELKSRLGRDAVFLAGGTDLVVGVAKGRLDIGHWIDLSRLSDLSYVAQEDGGLRIGASCTHAMLEASPYRALAQAARLVGGPQIRNRGTVGGNLGTASPAGDVNIALLAFDAEVELLSLRGGRRVSLREFFLSPGKTVMEPDEMIAAVRIPACKASGFLKVGKRLSVAISVVCCAVARLADGRIGIALGSVAPTPLRASKAEDLLASNGLNADTIVEAARLVSEEVRPIDDHRASADYRRHVSGVLARRLLAELS
jgi:probable selenate reductase FAD-binding subunit